MDQGTHITLKVKSQDGSEVFFRMNRGAQMRRVMEQYCFSKELKNIDAVRFVFDGTRLHPDNTPLQLNLEEGDEIDAFEEQIGGGGVIYM